MMKQQATNFLLVGVGGQGTILASNVLSEVGLKLGFDVKKAEVHGMSQRGGSVNSHLRWAEEVHSPLIPRGGADYLIAFEKVEAVRYIDFLKPTGQALVNRGAVLPVSVSSGGASYPADDEIQAAVRRVSPNLHWIDGEGIAAGLGNVKAVNVVLLGALCALLGSDTDVWKDVIRSHVPAKFADLNLKAFDAGMAAVR